MSGEAEKRQRELEVMLTLSFQFTQRLGAWVIHYLPNWTVSVRERESLCSQPPFKTIGNPSDWQPEEAKERNILPKAIFYLTTAAGEGWGMVWKWDRRDREGRQAGTYEWMKHNVWQTLWHSWWKNRHVHVTDLKDLQRRRQDTSHPSSLIHIQWMLWEQ